MIALKSVLVCLFLFTDIGNPIFETNRGSYRTLPVEEAEKALGQRARLTQQNLEEKDGLVSYKSTYQATANDKKTGNLGTLYYVFEKYPNETECQKVFTGIIESNRDMPGQEQSTDIGDETWIHTDQSNFYLIMFRKENKIVRAKINKLTSHTDLSELHKSLQKIEASLN